MGDAPAAPGTMSHIHIQLNLLFIAQLLGIFFNQQTYFWEDFGPSMTFLYP